MILAELLKDNSKVIPEPSDCAPISEVLRYVYDVSGDLVVHRHYGEASGRDEGVHLVDMRAFK